VSRTDGHSGELASRTDGHSGELASRTDGHSGELASRTDEHSGESGGQLAIERGGGRAAVRPGDIVHARITYAAPHHLNADGPLVSHRRTRAGDVWEAGEVVRTPSVVLGMPTVGAPAPLPAAHTCAHD
jgi:tRNA-2-methylthio-N6-dimethylallyladenosine synthase